MFRSNGVWSAGWVCVVVVALGLGLPTTHALAQDVARGAQLYQLCATCHGAAGQGNQARHAPVIAGLPRWYIEAQLGKFKEGYRAYRAEDTAGLQMKPMARSLVTDADLQAVAAYVAAMKAVQPATTVKGNAEAGKAAYVVCLACHGDHAQGNQGLGAPPLARQADWYLAAQIVKFRQGLRGTHPKDTTGATMRPMSMTLADEQAIANVISYIRTLTP